MAPRFEKGDLVKVHGFAEDGHVYRLASVSSKQRRAYSNEVVGALGVVVEQYGDPLYSQVWKVNWAGSIGQRWIHEQYLIVQENEET